MSRKTKGTLIIIGGHEDKEGDRVILSEVARFATKGTNRLVLMTVATQLPKELADDYVPLFKELGIAHVDVSDIRTREDAYNDKQVELLKHASAVFFTGGDQLRITSQIGGTPVFDCIQAIYDHGGVVAGTSAGAAAMSETMLVSGSSDASHELFDLAMSSGLGFVSGVVFDSHFAERGRIGRLLGAVAQNPQNLGIGIDENTAIVIETEGRFRVMGSGAVYVIDGSHISYSNLSEKVREGVLSIADMTLHVLGDGDTFDLINRRALFVKETEAE